MEEEQYEAEGFVSDDGRHTVEWDYWHFKDDLSDVPAPAWVCTTHRKLYYIDCIKDAQTD